jgi:hypothetical protein
MPFEIKRYACSFCKRFVRASKERVELHEPTCFYNPDRRSCRTCQWEVWDGGRDCKFGMLVNTPEEKYKDIGIRWMCPEYEVADKYV